MIVKPGFKTTEFLVTILVGIGSVAASLADQLQPHWAALASSIAAAAYAISRSITKNGALSGPSAIVTTEPVAVPPPTTQRPV